MTKLAADGTHLLSKGIAPMDRDASSAVAIDSENNIFVTGGFLSTADFGCSEPLTVSSPGTADLFLAKYSPAGTCEWANGFAAASTSDFSSGISDVVTNRINEVSITGFFYSPITLGETQLRSTGSNDIFAARFRSDGTYLSSIRAGGIDVDGGSGIAQSDDGQLFVTGRYAGLAEFDGTTVTTAGAVDSFIAAFAPL